MTRMWIVWMILIVAGCGRSTETLDIEQVRTELRNLEQHRLRSIANQPVSLEDDFLSVAQSGHDRGIHLHLVDFSDDAAAPASSPARREDRMYRPLPGLGDTIWRDIRHARRDLWRDTKRVYASPLNLAILGVTYGGSLALQEAGPDDTIERHYNRHHSLSKGWRKSFDALGHPGTHFVLAGAWYLVGQQTHDDKTYEVGKTLGSALLINGATVLLGQAASADRAPNDRYGTFPSGHTSSSFVVASVLHEAYGPAVGIPLYGLATMVGIQRIDDREHYFSDVVMGAVLGLVVGHSVAGGRQPEIFGWKVIPYADPQSGATGIALAKETR